MRYRLTALTPLLVGDGRRLSPIDYMVWKDHVNVLDQWRIFRLLAKGAAARRLSHPAEDRAKAGLRVVGRVRAELRRPAHSVRESRLFDVLESRERREPAHSDVRRGRVGRLSAGTAIKGALRTGMVFANWREGMLQDVLGRVKGERLPRRPAESVEEQALGPAGVSRMRLVSVGDSAVVASAEFKIYLLRTSTLQPRGGNFTLGWKTSPRGAVDGARPDDSTPVFAEMAAPGTTFTGAWEEKRFFQQPEVRRSVRWPESFDRAKIFEAVNVYAAGLLSLAAALRVVGRDGIAGSKPDRARSAAGRGSRERALPACASDGAAGCLPNRRGSTRPIPITARFCRSMRITTGLSRRICRFRKRARSCSWGTVRRRCPDGRS